MKFSTIRIEGAILSADILDKIEEGDLGGQTPKDFGFESNVKVKDRIANAWANAQDQWGIFERQRETVSSEKFGTSETRKYWINPLLGFLGYDINLSKAEELFGKTYAISHRTENLDGFPVHVMGFNDSLDKKREDSGPRMSPHALVQEYLNLTEHLYAIVTNGLQLRLLRDSSRLIKLSYIEFNLESMMEDEHYADFAILYRLLHASRMPEKFDAGAESKIEKYHQDALDSGSRIREGLSEAVEYSIVSLANGFLSNPDNEELLDAITNEDVSANDIYQNLLKLIYRLLFLMVIEERNLVYPNNADKRKRKIYYDFYSVSNLRRMCEKRYLLNKKHDDLWMLLKNTFRLFDDEFRGNKLGLKPLGGDLFFSCSIGMLSNSRLDNEVLLDCLKNLSVFINKKTGQKMRVNYGSLNVEEFGSVYEGLLERDPVLTQVNGYYEFELVKGEGRSVSGSHYTPDELVQPLIKHSLDYIIEDKLKENNPEEALLSISVCDVACGSGHILLNAARRIGTELAKLLTGEDQPSPEPLRAAIRDVIRNCIYGVDKNPLAVELCKVALWLEAHNPGEPLNFLDHHIRCGDSIVGLAHKEELENGIATEAFKTLPGDDKEIAAALRKRNKEEINTRGQLTAKPTDEINKNLATISDFYGLLNKMPETSPAEVETKQEKYNELSSGNEYHRLKLLADTQVAQFFIPKTLENREKLITDTAYRDFLSGEKPASGQAVAKAEGMSTEKRFFHWFLEYPEIFGKGGFDCILGNPPYLGQTAISGTFGDNYLNWVNYYFTPAAGCDLIVYFLRRNYDIIKYMRFVSLITTNSISEGRNRSYGLEIILNKGGSIIFVIKSIKWPGIANLYISLLTIAKMNWSKNSFIDNKEVNYINAYFEDNKEIGNPYNLKQNENQVFIGSKIQGDGFILTKDEMDSLVKTNTQNNEVLFPLINGRDLNEKYDQSHSRFIINFFEWSISRAKHYIEPFSIVNNLVYPERSILEEKNSVNQKRKEFWWHFGSPATSLYKSICAMNHCFIIARTTKYLNYSSSITKMVFSEAIYVYACEKFSNYSILQSSIHNEWARKYSSSLETRLRYAPTDCFETYPFPHIIPSEEEKLEAIGKKYHEFRRRLMLKLQLGLTKTYNLFHTKGLTVEVVEKASKQERAVCKEAYEDILKLRRLHKEMDEAVLSAYGWSFEPIHYELTIAIYYN